jgi:hypothetical protein
MSNFNYDEIYQEELIRSKARLKVELDHKADESKKTAKKNAKQFKNALIRNLILYGFITYILFQIAKKIAS